MPYAEVLLPLKFDSEKETLTYEFSEDMGLKKGQSVEVNLRNKKSYGLVLNIHNQKPKFRTIKVSKIMDQEPLLSESQIHLLKWISSYYFCPLYKTLKLFVPKRILTQKPFRKKAENIEQIIVSDTLTLTSEQEEALSTISGSNLNKFLIHGITGSGKTEIFTHLAKDQIANNRQVVILVPEISLTPQTIAYFEGSLGIHASVIHSKLSEGEKYAAWENIWKGEAKLVIGSRSAIFSPFKNLGLIIMDEEHEFSYKQDSSPRYTTHKVAEKIQELNPGVKLIFASATPSIETREKLKDATIFLKKRVGISILPEVEIVDLREEFQKKNFSIFSDSLKDELTNILEKKKQALLFINRRGTASSVVCRDCGKATECPTCEISMTYHSFTLSTPRLICHHCGRIDNPPVKCKNCESVNIRFLGIGTERIEKDLIKEFPGVRVLRADKDTTSNKTGFQDIYKAFKNHEADVLVGTQMIAKGLHLPLVDLVGVVLADIGLSIPDFRTLERNFQLLTQVTGRAGRSGKSGKVIIQTYNPDNIALLSTKAHSYEQFLNYERTQRKILNNPPFSQIAKITVADPSAQTSQTKAEQIAEFFQKLVKDEIEINTYPAFLYRLRGKYRNIVLLKDSSYKLHDILKKLPERFLTDMTVKIDIDPITTT